MKFFRKLSAMILAAAVSLACLTPQMTMAQSSGTPAADTSVALNLTDQSGDAVATAVADLSESSDMADMESAELVEGEGELSDAQGSAIYVMMAEGAAEPPAGSELVWILQQYDGADWIPASDVGYHTFDESGLTCDKDLYTDEDGSITLVKTGNGYPYVRFIEAEVYLNPDVLNKEDTVSDEETAVSEINQAAQIPETDTVDESTSDEIDGSPDTDSADEAGESSDTDTDIADETDEQFGADTDSADEYSGTDTDISDEVTVTDMEVADVAGMAADETAGTTELSSDSDEISAEGLYPEGEYRIVSDPERTSSDWGEFLGYATEEADRPYDLNEHEGIAFVYSGMDNPDIPDEYETEDLEDEIAVLTIKEVVEDDVLYLSDIGPVYQYVGWGYLRKDLNPSDTTITLRVDGAVTSFEKGIGAHAESILIYDVQSVYAQGYDSFLTYYGVNSTMTTGNVKFYMYTTTDSDYATAEWTEVEGVDSSAKSGSSSAGFIEIPLDAEMTYLKLYADPNGGNGSDHSVYGDAKFVKRDQYFDEYILPLEVYDAQLKEYYELYGDDISQNTEYEDLLLKRELVYRTGYYEFQDLLASSDGSGIKEMLDWVFANRDFLKMYLTGGSVGGNYRTGAYSYSGSSNDPMTASIRVMYELWQKYPQDFENTARNSLYPKMIISISLTLTGNVKYWFGTTGSSSSDPADNSIIYPDPVERYEIYKQLYAAGMLVDYFDELQVPEMRYVMASPIHNDEIVWASNLAKEKNYNTNCYYWMSYVSGYSYHRDQYYDSETWLEYSARYKLAEYDISNYGYGDTTSVKYPMLWMCMADGGTCWPIANFCQNLWSSYGRPCYICGSMGGTHEVYMAYNRETDSSGNTYGRWTIENGCGGNWNNTHYGAYDSTGWHIARMIGDWGMGSEFEFNNSSYIILGQSAINDYENYVYAEELEMFSRVFEGDDEVLEKIYRDMLTVQSFHFDAWYGLVKLYCSSDKTDADRYNLACEMMARDALYYYPLPMYDLLKILQGSVSSGIYSYMISNNEASTLRSASDTTDSEFYSAYAVRIVANWLLGNEETDVATFSFDGENAGKIILSDQFSDPEYWEYSLDGGQTWSAIIHDTEVSDADGSDISMFSQTVVENPNVVQLTEEEIAQINPDDNILIRFIQVPDYWHVIDIEKSDTPAVGSIYDVTGLYANPWENCVVYAEDTMEWRYVGDTEWTSFRDVQPDRDEDTDFEVRYGAHSIYTAGDSVLLSYSNPDNFYMAFEDNAPVVQLSDGTGGNGDEESWTEDSAAGSGYSYIPLSRIMIYDHTAQASTTRDVKYSMDGSIYSFYQTPADTVFPHYLTLKLDRPTYLSGLTYQCNLGNTAGGQIKQARIYVSMTGEDDDWTEVEYLEGTDGLDSYQEDTGLQWITGNNSAGKTPKNVYFTPVQAQYVKIVSYADGGVSRMTSIAAVRLYERDDMADRDKLEELLTQFQLSIDSLALNEKDYISATWSLLQKAMNEAESRLNDPDATQEEIDSAYHSLLAAFDGLEISESLAGTITWDDDDDRDGIRPAYVTMNILADGALTDTVEIYADSDGSSWSYLIGDLAVNEDVNYTAEMEDINGYSVKSDGEGNFSLTHSPEMVSVRVQIIWDDDNDAAGKRPGTIRCHLLADGVKADSANLTYSNCKWDYTGFASRPRYSAGTEINYTVVLDSVTNPATGYTTAYRSDGTNFEIINTYNPDKTNVSLIVAWNDAGDQDGIRPDQVTAELIRGGVSTDQTLSLSAEKNWRDTFSDLDRYDESGEEISWSVAETEIDGYSSTLEYTDSCGFVITYTHLPETTDLSGTKIWDDKDDAAGARPLSAALYLHADGEKISQLKVDDGNGWTWTAENLPCNKNGVPIVYTVTEDPVDDYICVVTGYDVTNVYHKNEISIPVSINWQDVHDESDRPDEVTVNLTRHGAVTDIVLVLDASSGWSGSFSGLEEYEGNIPVAYGVSLSLSEIVQDRYQVNITQSSGGGFTITMTRVSSASSGEFGSDRTESDGSEIAEDAEDRGQAGSSGTGESTDSEKSGYETDTADSSYAENGAVDMGQAGVVGSVQVHWEDGVTAKRAVSVTVVDEVPSADSVQSGTASVQPGDVTVVLYDSGGNVSKTVDLSAENGWTCQFTLGCEEGSVITAQSAGYDCEISGSAWDGFTVTAVSTNSVVKAGTGENGLSGEIEVSYQTAIGAGVSNQNQLWIFAATGLTAAAAMIILVIRMICRRFSHSE